MSALLLNRNQTQPNATSALPPVKIEAEQIVIAHEDNRDQKEDANLNQAKSRVYEQEH